jgi:Methyltransferase domain
MAGRQSSPAGLGSKPSRKDTSERRAEQLVERGRERFSEGELSEALECCRRALALCATLSSAYYLMADVVMPGMVYKDVLKLIHESLPVKSYAEIGVRYGDSLALAKPDASVVGIDPRPLIGRNINARAKLYPVTSDQFFESYDLLAELGAPRLELAFIDGLHRFEQVLKDLINIERYADDKTIVLIHDCLPVARLTATREQVTDYWCGDVWKIVRCLRDYRPDLVVGVVPARPSGLGMITNLDPGSTVLREHYDEIVERYRSQELHYEFLDLDAHHPSKMVPNLIPNDWPQIAGMLPGGLTRPARV